MKGIVFHCSKKHDLDFELKDKKIQIRPDSEATCIGFCMFCDDLYCEHTDIDHEPEINDDLTSICPHCGYANGYSVWPCTIQCYGCDKEYQISEEPDET